MSEPEPNESRFPAVETVSRRTIYMLLLFLCFASYRGIFDNWLFNDDFSWLSAARYDMTPGNLFTFRVVEFFRPLVNLSFWSMGKAAPGNIPMHYAFNLALHFLCALLVFHLTLKLLESSWLAAAAAALFAVTSVHAYLLFRQTLMGGYVQDNWGPGSHALRNVASGFLDQLYPWPFFSLFYRPGTIIPESSSVFNPESAALPVAGVLVLAGCAARKTRAMILAVEGSPLAFPYLNDAIVKPMRVERIEP